jgi:hemerythrin-like domain-containing protein
MPLSKGATRRSVLKRGMLVGPALLLGDSEHLRAVLRAESQGQGEEDVSTVEDLMREHGVLRRVLLVYGETIRRIRANEDVPAGAVAGAAELIRTFVEDYHEKLEEDHLFPRFQKAGTLVDLVKVLREQHEKGRTLTSDVRALATAAALKGPGERAKLADRLQAFIRMYEPHAAREDTVLFPAFKTLVSPKEYDALGDEFEKKEQQMFGEDGFGRNVQTVAGLEKQMGIYDLSRFTPRV